jgi:hypothetical protein
MYRLLLAVLALSPVGNITPQLTPPQYTVLERQIESTQGHGAHCRANFSGVTNMCTKRERYCLPGSSQYRQLQFQCRSLSFTTWADRYTPNVDLSSAEFINEDQPASFDFLGFGSQLFENTDAYGTWGSSNQYTIQKGLSDSVTLSSFTAYKGTPSSPGAMVAYPGGISTGGGFTDYATSNDSC